MKSSKENILHKLSAFVSDYYKNELQKGAILGLIFLGGAALVILFFEHFLKFNSAVRTVLFFGFVLLGAYILIRYVVWPTLGIFKLRSGISDKKAAELIGSKISKVEDRLLNRLQLQEYEQSSLAKATINKRDVELQAIDFQQAIERSWWQTGAIAGGIMLAVYTLVTIINPAILTDSSKRIIEYDVAHHLIPPFDIDVDYLKEVRRGDDITINLQFTGAEQPAFIEIIDNETKVIAGFDKGSFTQQLTNRTSDGSFHIKIGKYELGPYAYVVKAKPEILGGRVKLSFPNHTGIDNQELGLEDKLSVPEGTSLSWLLDLVDTKEVHISLSSLEDNDDLLHIKDEQWTEMVSAQESFNYSFIATSDTLIRDYSIQVIKDEYPRIAELTSEQDSTSGSYVFLSGYTTDDYGISSIAIVLSSDGEQAKRISLPVTGGQINEPFQSVLDLSGYDKQGKAVTYFVEVRDNDAPNGYKATRSSEFVYKPLTKDEKLEQLANSRADNTDALKEIVEELSNLNEKIQRQKEIQLTEKGNDWTKQQELKKFKESFKELSKEMESLQESTKEQNAETDPLLEQAEELMKEINDLLDKLNKKQEVENLEELQMSSEELEREMKANLELYKQMAFELGVEEAIDRLEELAKEEQSLADSNNLSGEERKEAQDSLNKSFNKLDDRLEELKKEKNELKKDMDLELNPSELDDAEQNMKNASKEAQENKQGQSKESQKSAAAQMREAVKKMRNSLMNSRAQQQTEDMENLRAIQENLLHLSFDQEAVLNTQLQTAVNDPMYRSATVDQKQVEADFSVVKDSLYALSERVDQLKEKIGDEVRIIERSLSKATEAMEGRNKSASSQRQREGMTSMNNLALMLSEVVQQMQQQMAQDKFGDGTCSKPGKGSKSKPSMSEMKAKQKALQQEMAKMKEKLEKGKSPGASGKDASGKKGEKGGDAKELAKMAAQQQAIREAMQRMAEDATRNGGGLSKELKKLADEMEKVEKDILEREIEAETLKRQQDIINRMLKAENAMREQEQDEKRESSSGNKQQKQEEDSLDEYLKKREREVELLRRNNVNLQPYFNNRYSIYINQSQ